MYEKESFLKNSLKEAKTKESEMERIIIAIIVILFSANANAQTIKVWGTLSTFEAEADVCADNGVYPYHVTYTETEYKLEQKKALELRQKRVLRGETLSQIARDYDVPMQTLVKLNAHNAADLFMGKSLKIRAGRKINLPAEAKKAEKKQGLEQRLYRKVRQELAKKVAVQKNGPKLLAVTNSLLVLKTDDNKEDLVKEIGLECDEYMCREKVSYRKPNQWELLNKEDNSKKSSLIFHPCSPRTIAERPRALSGSKNVLGSNK